MKTPHNAATEFLAALHALGFRPAPWDKLTGNRQLQTTTEAGHPLLRVCLDYQGEIQPHNLSVIRFDGRQSQTVEWSCDNLSAHMPSAALLAMLQAA